MSKHKTTLKSVYNRHPNIMADIGVSLEKAKIKCKKSQSEIIAINSNKKAIKMVISPLITKQDSKILLNIVGVGSNVYIRQRYGL